MQRKKRLKSEKGFFRELVATSPAIEDQTFALSLAATRNSPQHLRGAERDVSFLFPRCYLSAHETIGT